MNDESTYDIQNHTLEKPLQIGKILFLVNVDFLVTESGKLVKNSVKEIAIKPVPPRKSGLEWHPCDNDYILAAVVDLLEEELTTNHKTIDYIKSCIESAKE